MDNQVDPKELLFFTARTLAYKSLQYINWSKLSDKVSELGYDIWGEYLSDMVEDPVNDEYRLVYDFLAGPKGGEVNDDRDDDPFTHNLKLLVITRKDSTYIDVLDNVPHDHIFNTAAAYDPTAPEDICLLAKDIVAMCMSWDQHLGEITNG